MSLHNKKDLGIQTKLQRLHKLIKSINSVSITTDNFAIFLASLHVIDKIVKFCDL